MSRNGSSLTPLLGKDNEQYTKLQSSEQSHDELKNQVLENYKILSFTAASFLLFVICEIIGALMSGSLSLLGGNYYYYTISYTSFNSLLLLYKKRCWCNEC
jgi:hypothetical protein